MKLSKGKLHICIIRQMKQAIGSDSEIVLHIKRGNIDYYSHIVRKYTPRILAFILTHLYDKKEGEDLTQNTFIAFYKAIERFDEDRPVLPYLYQIAKNELKMYYRQRRETVPLNEEIAAPLSGELFGSQDVIPLLDTVTPEQKQALQMVVDGFSYKEIAAKLKKNINTVRTLIRRARLLLIEKNKHEDA